MSHSMNSPTESSLIKKEIWIYGTAGYDQEAPIHRVIDNLNTQHNKAIAHINLMKLYKQKFQDNQEFMDQYIDIRKICDELDL